MSSEQEQKPSGPNFSPNVPDLKPIRYAGARTLGLGILPPVQYGLFSEKIRQNGSKRFQCSVFCEGKKCRYEDPSSWAPEDMAIKGIYSCWVTDNIVTMARPSASVIEKYKIINQFKELGIRSLINLQERGEHGSCGVPLQPSGFSYDPQLFMDNNIFYYNFDWKDYGNVSKTRLLDIVKVLAFATSEGRVAIHSHSGLGRTGVLIACYFIYTWRCKPNDAIFFLRSKRPQIVQTKGQVRSVQGFTQFVVPMFIVYAHVIKSPRDFRSNLTQYLKRQRLILHGVEARILKHVPKPVFMYCEKLLALLDENRLLEVTNNSGKIDFFQGNPNSLFGYYSSQKYQLDLKFPSKFKKQWSLVLKDKKLLKGDRKRLPNGRLDSDQRFCAPPSPAGGLLAKFDERTSQCPDSPESSSSGDESNLRSSSDRLGGGLYRPLEEEDFLDYHLSEDEENGLNPELEYCNNVNIDLPNSIPVRQSPPNKSSGKKSTQYIIANGNATILQNGGIGMNNNSIVFLGNQNLKTVAEMPKVDVNENIKNHDETLPEELVIEYPFGEPAEEEEDDLLEDMNSEECNAIIDSVLQESASEEEVPSIGHKSNKKKRKDVDAIKDIKGCSTTTTAIEEESEGREQEKEVEENKEVHKDDEEEVEDEEEEEENIALKETPKTAVVNALLGDHYAMGEEFDSKLKKHQKAINNHT